MVQYSNEHILNIFHYRKNCNMFSYFKNRNLYTESIKSNILKDLFILIIMNYFFQ